MDQLTQQQQIDRVKRWLRQNAVVLIASAVISVGSITGWIVWSNLVEQHQQGAFQTFEQLRTALDSQQEAQIEASLSVLENEYQDTPYLMSARLHLAQHYYENNMKELAVKQLRTLLDEQPEQVVREITANRLARLYIDIDRPDDALALVNEQLGQVLGESALSNFYIIQSDAYQVKGQYDAARTALDNASKNLPEHSQLKELVKLKRNDIANRR